MKAFFFLTVLALFTSSCDSYLFETPLPTDQTDLKKFPKAWHGTYLANGDTISITENEIAVVSLETKQVLQKELDQAINFKLDEKGVYLIDTAQDPDVEGAFPYQRINDELIEVYTREENVLRLGFNAQLRRLGKDYILNFKTPEFSWWLVAFLSEDDQYLQFHLLSFPDETALNNYTEIFRKGQSSVAHFWSANWTEKEMLDYLESGAIKLEDPLRFNLKEKKVEDF
jgi:hypothetical protein